MSEPELPDDPRAYIIIWAIFLAGILVILTYQCGYANGRRAGYLMGLEEKQDRENMQGVVGWPKPAPLPPPFKHMMGGQGGNVP